MLTLIHGEDTTASRNYYFDLKQKSQENTVLDGTTISLTDLQQALSGNDLFGETKSIFIENLISKRKSPKEIESLISLIPQISPNVVLWESKELTRKQVALLKGAQVKLFKIPAAIFAFLDSLRPDNDKLMLALFHDTLKDKDAEFVLPMLERQVRILLALCHPEQGHPELVSGSQQISEVSRLAPWQMTKLEKQAHQFTKEQLLSLHSKLFQLDLGLKTGDVSQSLENEIDMLLLSF